MSEDDVVLRSPKPGELSWLQWRHMQVMAPRYDWGQAYEANIAEIISGFLTRPNTAWERFWVAARGDQVLGCVGLTGESEDRARLRLLFVEPDARGQGIGRKLVQACLGFARRAGYREVVLWTVDVLESARKIYADAGFRRIGSTASELSPSMQDETWILRF